MNLLEAGHYYLKRGLSVIPFKRDKSSCCLSTWKQYQEKHASASDVESWFEKKFSKEFIAIVTGKISGIMVVDCDTQQAYEKIQEHIPASLITPIAKSPHGYHIYFKYREGLSSRRYMPDVDVKTDGGCICAPPSVNGNGLGYLWLNGLSIEHTDFAVMPDDLYYLLLQYRRGGLGGNVEGQEDTEGQKATKETNSDKLFTEGQRDEDLFHVANCLTKGGCEKYYTHKVLEILAKNCNPPYQEKDIQIKVESALGRKAVRERNLAYEVRDWVLATNGVFLATNCVKELQIATKDDRRNVNKILERLSKANPPIIEKVGNRDGEWKLSDNTCEELDWINADCSYKPLWLPLGLDEVFGAHPGNVIMIAGAKDSGKTEWLLNIAKMNRYTHKIHYFNSEMGPAEFKQRAMNFKDVSIQQWKDVKVYERYNDFHAVIKPGEGNLNIIDFIEITDEFWKIGSAIRKIHEALKGAICIIGLQKKKGAEYGRGAEFSIEKARLYISLDYGLAKIVSCKNYRPESTIGNGRGYTCNFTVKRKCEILFNDTSGWTKPLDK